MAAKSSYGRWINVATVAMAALMIVGFASANAQAKEPIVGFWAMTTKDADGNVVDHIFSGWTSDGLEFDQDVVPILIENACYGKWIKVGPRTYGLTHPFFNFNDINFNGEGTEETEGQWDGSSGLITYTVIVAKDAKTFTGKEILKIVSGPDPYDPNATVLDTFLGMTVTGKRIDVDKSQLP